MTLAPFPTPVIAVTGTFGTVPFPKIADPVMLVNVLEGLTFKLLTRRVITLAPESSEVNSVLIPLVTKLLVETSEGAVAPAVKFPKIVPAEIF